MINVFISSPIKAPRVNGVTALTRMLFVGLFPWKTLWGSSWATWSALMPDFCNSSLAWSALFPFMRASVWARKLASRILWCSVPWTCEKKIKKQSNIGIIVMRLNYCFVPYCATRQERWSPRESTWYLDESIDKRRVARSYLALPIRWVLEKFSNISTRETAMIRSSVTPIPISQRCHRVLLSNAAHR